MADVAPAPVPSAVRRKVLVTGAAGQIGSYFSEATTRYYDLRLMVRAEDEAQRVDAIRAYGEIVVGNVSNLDEMKNICAGVDTVIHLAGDPSPDAVWRSVFHNNIEGTYITFVAAKSAGCRRVIYASSIHAVSGYPADVQVKPDESVNPGDLYGVSKCFGEAMARYMAEQEGLSAICIRIGAFQPIEAARDERSLDMLDAWVSRRDLNQLLVKCVDDEKLKFAIFHGLSDNRFKRLDISNARELVGYAPEDDLTNENPILKRLHLRDVVPSHNQGDERQRPGIREEA